MKKFISLIIAVSLIISLISCTPKNDANRIVFKVAFWGSTVEYQAIKKIAEKIQDELDNVALKLEHIPIGQDPTVFSQKILTEAAGGTPPDIAFCEVNLFVDFYNKGLFVPLNEYLDKDKDFNIKDYFESIVDRFTVDNQIYIIPRDVAPVACVYYNKELFNREGLAFPADDWTVYDLLAYAKKLTKHGANGKITQYGFYTWSWVNFLYTWGGSIVDDIKKPKRFTLNTPEAKAALQFYWDLMYTYKVMPTPAALQAGYQELFKTGKLAMYCDGVWHTPDLRKGLTFDWDVVMFPKGPKGSRAFTSGGSGYGILKYCKHKELAWQIVKRLASAEAQKDLARIGLAQPADKKLAASKVWALSDEKPANKKMLNEAVKTIKFDPFTSKWNYIWRSIVLRDMDLVWLNKIRLQPALDKINKAATAELNK